MKFSALFTLGLATSVVATPAFVVRDSAAVTGVISDISDKVDALDSAIGSFSGSDSSKVESASADLISTINKGADSVKGGDDLTTTDALALTSPVQDLTKKVESTVDKLISKKSDFESAGAAGKVKSSLDAQLTAANGLAAAISGKVPESLADIAKQLSSGISDAIQKGVDAYKDAKDSSDSSSTGSASASATATATGSATESGDSSATATATGSSSETATGSSSVIPTPTSSGAASSSATPSSSGAASGSASASGSATPSESGPALHTGAASSNRFSYTFGGAVAAAAMVAAF